MVSEKKVVANRKNAKKSTGPRSRAGKARASLNSLRHGLTTARSVILDGESEAEFVELRTGLHQAWRPIGGAEVFLVDRMVQHGWQMGRARRVEVELFSRQIISDEADRLETALAPKFRVSALIASEFPSGLAPAVEADSEKQIAEKRLSMAGLRLGTSFVGLSSDEDLLGKVQRYQTTAERSFFRAAHELERLQRRRIGEHVAAPEVKDVDISFDRAALADPNQVPVVRAPGTPQDRKAAPSQPAMPLPTAQDLNCETKPTDAAVARAAVVPAAREGVPNDMAADVTKPADAAKSNFETKPLIDAGRARMEPTKST